MTLNASGISPNTYDTPVAMATGSFTGDGSGSVSANIGFSPKVVTLIDMAATTGSSRYEWVLGMAATDTLLENGTTDIAIDANSAVVSNMKANTQVSAGEYGPPGSQEPTDGTLVNSGTITVYSPDPTTAKLTFGINTSSHIYVWYAFG